MDPAILIAVADESLRDSYAMLLAEQGYRVVTASGGLDCLNKLCRVVPEVLVLDKELLWGGGDGVLAVLRDGGNTLWPPVILLTQDKSDGLYNAQTAPVVMSLQKPIRLDELLDQVEIARNATKPASEKTVQGQALPNSIGVAARLLNGQRG
jgi:two-component system response regulator AtoC